MATIRNREATLTTGPEGWRLRTKDGLEDSGDWPTDAKRVLSELTQDAELDCSCHLSNLFEPANIAWARNHADSLTTMLQGPSLAL